MKTLIVYESRYGSVKKAVDYISVKLLDAPDVMTSTDALKMELSGYDCVIIGGSVMVGKVQKEITKFIETRKSELLKKKIALFLAAASPEKEVIEKEINDAFPQELRNISLYTAHAGYGFNFEKMNFMFKMIIKKMSKIDHSVTNINFAELDRLAQAVNKGKAE